MSLLRKDKNKNENAETPAPAENLRVIGVEFKSTAAYYHATVENGRDIQFQPGRNEIRETDWNFLLTNPHFKRDVDAGIFEISQGDDAQ